jgi:hypothetical protein
MPSVTNTLYPRNQRHPARNIAVTNFMSFGLTIFSSIPLGIPLRESAR